MGVKDHKSGDLQKKAKNPFDDNRDSLDELAKSFGHENFYDLSEIGNVDNKGQEPSRNRTQKVDQFKKK